jgi:hypothetical protein
MNSEEELRISERDRILKGIDLLSSAQFTLSPDWFDIDGDMIMVALDLRKNLSLWMKKLEEMAEAREPKTGYDYKTMTERQRVVRASELMEDASDLLVPEDASENYCALKQASDLVYEAKDKAYALYWHSVGSQ